MLTTFYHTNHYAVTGHVVKFSYNSYLPVIGVHEMHDRMHPNYWQITILLVVDLCSSLAYFMMTHPLPIASKLPIKTLVAKQLPTNYCTCTCIANHCCSSQHFCKPAITNKAGHPFSSIVAETLIIMYTDLSIVSISIKAKHLGCIIVMGGIGNSS